MAQLPVYNRQYGFIAFQQSNPADPLPADKVEIEYNAIKTVLDAARTNLALIQRDDGELANESVGNDQLEVSLRTGINPPTAWTSATAYSVNDTVVYTDGSRSELWLITEAHTSSSAFDDDSAKMRKLADWLDVLEAAANVTYDNTASGLAATDVKAAIDEIDAAIDALTAASVAYSNSASGLSATDVQAAIDEIASGGSNNVVSDTTPQLGGALDVNGNKIVSSSNGDIELDPNGTGDIVLGASIITVEQDIVHAGDADTLIRFGTDTQALRTGGTTRLDVSNSGVRLGGANARVATVLNENDMVSDRVDALVTQKSVKALFDNGVGIPAGTVADFAGTSAPTGWLLCYGQAVSRTTYANLFNAIGTSFGTGDGSTTFGLPDLRGRVAAGKDDMGGAAASRMTSGGSGVDGTTLGAAGGTETHTLAVSEIPAHNHSILTGSGTGTSRFEISKDSAGTASGDTENTGGGGAHQNTQPSIVLNKIIKT